MPAFDLKIYTDLIVLVDAATTPNEKGARFEDLSQYLLGTLDGIDIVERDANMEAEEIDLILWNAPNRGGVATVGRRDTC